MLEVSSLIGLVLVCAAVTCPPPPSQLPPSNPLVFDTGFIERFARGMAEGGPVIEEIAVKNNRNNPTFRFVITVCLFLLS